MNIYLLTVNNKDTSTTSLDMEKLHSNQWRRSGVFIINYEQISPRSGVFHIPRSSVSIVDLEQVDAHFLGCDCMKQNSP